MSAEKRTAKELGAQRGQKPSRRAAEVGFGRGGVKAAERPGRFAA